MSATSILRCNCNNPYQDKKYGKQMRIHNHGMTKKRCTVCGKES